MFCNFCFRKNQLVRLVALAVIMLSSNMAAADINTIRDINDKITVMLSAQNLDYKEYRGGEILDSEKGIVPGVEISIPLADRKSVV